MAEGLPKIDGRAITSPGSISNAGAAERAQAGMFGRVAQASMQIGKALEPLAIKEGEEDAIRDWVEQDKLNEGRGPGKVTRRSGFLGLQTAGDVSYNNMMETLYLQKTKGALEAEAQNLANRAETFGDVDAFDADFSGFVEGLGAEIDPEFAEEFYLLTEKVQTETRSKIASQKQQADIAEAKTSMDMNLATLEDSILADALAGGYEAMGRQDVREKLQEYQNQLTIKTQNPLYAYSPMESERDFRAFKVKINAAALTPDVKDVFSEEGYGAALQYADEEVAALGLPPGETSSLRNSLRNEINLMRQNEEALRLEEKAKEDAAKAAREAAADEADRRVTDALLNDAPEDELRQRLAIARNLVSPERYLTLSNKVMDPAEKRPMDAGVYASNLLAADRGELSYNQIIQMTGSPEQLKTLIDRSNSYLDATLKPGLDTIKAYYSQADALISSIDPNDQTKGQLLKVGEQEAYNELRSWSAEQVAAGKSPRPAEMLDEAQRIAVRNGRTSGVVANSRYLKVDLSGNIDPASVSAARDAITQDRLAGRLTIEEARKELAKIKLAEEGMKNAR